MDFTEFGLNLLSVVSPLLLTLLSYGVVRLNTWISQRIKNEAVASAVTRFNEAVFDTVKETNQMVVEGFKARAADGKLTAEDVAEIRELALKNVRSYLGMKGVLEICKILGLTDKQFDVRVGTKIDATVHDLKR